MRDKLLKNYKKEHKKTSEKFSEAYFYLINILAFLRFSQKVFLHLEAFLFPKLS